MLFFSGRMGGCDGDSLDGEESGHWCPLSIVLEKMMIIASCLDFSNDWYIDGKLISMTVNTFLMKLTRFWWQLCWNNWWKTEIIKILLMTLTRLSEMKSPPPDGLPPLYKSSPSRARVRNHTLSLSSLSQLSLLSSLSQSLSLISFHNYCHHCSSRAHLDVGVLGYIC